MAQTIVSSGKIVRPKRPKNEVESVTSIFFSEISNYLPESFQQLIVLSQPESDPEKRSKAKMATRGATLKMVKAMRISFDPFCSSNAVTIARLVYFYFFHETPDLLQYSIHF